MVSAIGFSAIGFLWKMSRPVLFLGWLWQMTALENSYVIFKRSSCVYLFYQKKRFLLSFQVFSHHVGRTAICKEDSLPKQE